MEFKVLTEKKRSLCISHLFQQPLYVKGIGIIKGIGIFSFDYNLHLVKLYNTDSPDKSKFIFLCR